MDYENYRFGSAGVPSLHDLKRAGLLTPDGISIGFDQTKRHELFAVSDGSIALFGGTGSGKSASAFANPLIGGHLPGNFILFDPRGELAAIVLLSLSLQGYAVHFIIAGSNPMGFPKSQCNPYDYLILDSPTLIPDSQKVALDFCPTPGGVRSSWSYDDARRWLGSIILYDAEHNGCASPTGIYDVLMSIQGNLDVWCNHLDAMTRSRFPSVSAFAEEIMGLQKEGRESFTAPIGILLSAFDYMRDPNLQWTFSGNDFSLQSLGNQNKKLAVILIWPLEYLQTQAPAIRQVLGAAIQGKLRKPGSAPVSVLIDEGGQLGNFPSVRELYTFGRGASLVNNMVAWQEVSQLYAAFGPQANEIIGSAQYRAFKGVRTIETAELVSRMSGTMTLEYDATMEQSNSRRLKEQAVQRMLTGGGFLEAAADIRHYKQAETHRAMQARAVLTPDEVMNMPPTQMVAFASGLVDGPIVGHWINHFDRADYAGKYLNNPYHGDEVLIKTRFGHRKVPVIEERVPEALAHLPQFKNGLWHYVQGYRPNLR